MWFRMNKVLTKYLTVDITTSNTSIKLIPLMPILWSGQRRIFSVRPLNGNTDCLRIYSQTSLLSWRDFIQGNTICPPCAWFVFGIKSNQGNYLTNNFSLTSLQVTNLYKNRWLIDLFFKWLKQNLMIKRFRGTSENVVKIQIYCAICAYCLVAIIQHDMQLNRSTYEVLHI